MKTFYVLFIFILAFSSSKYVSPKGPLVRFCENETCEIGSPMGYVNSRGDTIVPAGRYDYCYTDTIKTIGFVLDTTMVCKAINAQGQELYQVYWFDNGPDYLSDGLFRIVENDRIGYADASGKIVICPQFKCATPFHHGRARVSYDCHLEKDGEHSQMKSGIWFFIDKKGNKIE